MTDTRTRLLQEATTLVRQRGYCAFSYADLASAVGIRKASIHYYFPSKEDLGVELVETYSRTFLARLRQIRHKSPGMFERLEGYAEPYREGLPDNAICLCGVFAAEADAVPEQVRTRLERFFSANITWLTDVLQEGTVRGELRPDTDPAGAARVILSCLQGALLVARSVHDVSAFDQSVAAMLDGLRA